MVLRTHALYQLQAKHLKIVMALFLFGAVREYALLRDQDVVNSGLTRHALSYPLLSKTPRTTATTSVRISQVYDVRNIFDHYR